MSQPPPRNSTCRDAIVAFAELNLDRWHGLPACTHDDLAAALGPGGPEWDGHTSSDVVDRLTQFAEGKVRSV